jgi:hypothetical protein
MPAAAAQLAWLEQRGVMLGPSIESALSIGPQPHAYRRIRPRAGGFCLALKAWRVDFSVDASEEVAPRALCVHAVRSGYRPRELATDATLSLHRAFVAAFGA